MVQKLFISNNASFQTLRDGGYLYVDKTRYLYDLVREGGSLYFCARPRRFGKTLAVSTLEAIFQGKRDLFKGLYIDSTDYDWKVYPIIQVNFADCSEKSGQELDDWIRDLLVSIGRKHQIALDPQKPCRIAFKNLLDAFQNRGEKVVILVDEYDKVISDNLYNPELANLQQVLSGFYSVIKGFDQIIRFAFLTGVTKYAKLSVFSGMNNLNDISMSDGYSAMFGYTQEELEQNFAPYVDSGCKATGMARAEYLTKLKDMYDGYKFSPFGQTVYNPVSVGKFFSEGGRLFMSYWADTGNTRLLMDVARKTNFNLATEFGESVSLSGLSNFDIASLARTNVKKDELSWLLYQSGYLTIDHLDPVDELSIFLRFPNNEVAVAFSASLLGMYTDDQLEGNVRGRILDALDKNDMAKLVETLKSVFAVVVYPSNPKEYSFASILSVVFFFIKQPLAVNEFQTSEGRADMVLRLEKRIYLFEFKVDQSADVALQQIKDKHYADRFKTEGKPIHLVGISFSSKTRNIIDWKEETIQD